MLYRKDTVKLHEFPLNKNSFNMVNETRAVPLPEANTKTTHFFFFVSGKRSHTKHGKMGREFNVPHPAMPAKILDSDSYSRGT